MAVDWTSDWLLTAAGVAMMALAAFAFALRPGSRVNQALALVVFLRGLFNAAGVLGGDAGAGWEAAFRALGHYAVVVMLPALAFLSYAYRVDEGTAGPRPWIPWLCLVAGAALAVVHGVDRSLYFDAAGRPGPLFVLLSLFAPTYAIIALILLRDAFRRSPGRPRNGLLVASLAFAVLPGWGGVFWGGGLAGTVDDIARYGWAVTSYGTREFFWFVDGVVRAFALPIIVVVAWTAWRALRRETDQDARRPLARYLAWIMFAGATGALTFGASFFISWGAAINIGDSTWTLAFPFILSFAILRHQVFGLDVRVHRAVLRTIVVAAFAVAFFLVTGLVDAFADNVVGQYSWVWGGLFAGALLAALNPLQSLASRVADVVVPGVKPPSRMTPDERVALYNDWVRIAWRDGTLTAKERHLLETARVRLGLTAEEAMRLEREAVQATSPS